MMLASYSSISFPFCFWKNKKIKVLTSRKSIIEGREVCGIKYVAKMENGRLKKEGIFNIYMSLCAE